MIFSLLSDWEVLTLNLNGTGLTNLTNNNVDDLHSAWSPDGTKIAFASNRDSDGDWEIFVIDADGSLAAAGVHPTWRTAIERDVTGFNVWRLRRAGGIPARANRSPVPATHPLGGAYSFLDRSATAARRTASRS